MVASSPALMVTLVAESTAAAVTRWLLVPNAEPRSNAKSTSANLTQFSDVDRDVIKIPT
jgi:hypothetical protein